MGNVYIYIDKFIMTRYKLHNICMNIIYMLDEQKGEHTENN